MMVYDGDHIQPITLDLLALVSVCASRKTKFKPSRDLQMMTVTHES